MATATLPRKRKRAPVELEYPLPFSKLPPDVQERAIERYRNDPDNCYPRWDDVSFLTDQLVDDLEYEFGLVVHRKMVRSPTKGNPSRCIEEPELTWSTCPTEASFKTVCVYWDSICEHANPDGDYFHAEAQRLQELWGMTHLWEAAFGYDPDWAFHIPGNEDDGRFADYSVARSDLTDAAWDSLWNLCQELNAALAGYYKKACDRLCQIIDSEIEYHNSDECIAETLSANDHWTFDEEGDLDCDHL